MFSLSSDLSAEACRRHQVLSLSSARWTCHTQPAPASTSPGRRQCFCSGTASAMESTERRSSDTSCRLPRLTLEPSSAHCPCGSELRPPCQADRSPPAALTGRQVIESSSDRVTQHAQGGLWTSSSRRKLVQGPRDDQAAGRDPGRSTE